MRMLIQTQLSNYDTKGKFILECDSGWQMMMGRVRVMLEMDPNLIVDIMGPEDDQVRTDAGDINPDVWDRWGPNGEGRLNYVPHRILANALATRYDFDWTDIAIALDLGMHKIGRATKYDIVYLNDPMHLRNFRAMFFLVGGYTPKFVVHSHFIDDPDCPKFPTEASLWLGQCEAAMKADWNFWQCESAMKVFFNQMAKMYRHEVTKEVWEKSEPWDDGYSSGEITAPYDASNVRFDVRELERLAQEKVIIFVPNRIGGKGRSSDYTNCGHFMFNSLQRLSALRAEATGGRDYIVLCGNPSQKIFNWELEEWCGRQGYVSLVPDAFNRDEFKCVASHAHIALGLYNQDSYGGTVARECIELGCLPLWADNYEYSTIAQLAGWSGLTDRNMMHVAQDLSDLINRFKDPNAIAQLDAYRQKLQQVVRERCSYECTTPAAYERMVDLL